MAPVIFSARARLTMTIEVTLPCDWKGEATVNEIHKQAKANAVEGVTQILADSELKGRVVGDPTVHIISSEVIG